MRLNSDAWILSVALIILLKNLDVFSPLLFLPTLHRIGTPFRDPLLSHPFVPPPPLLSTASAHPSLIISTVGLCSAHARVPRTSRVSGPLGPLTSYTQSTVKSRVGLWFFFWGGVDVFLRARVCLWVHFCCQASPCTAAQACPGGDSLGGRSLSSQSVLPRAINY